MVNATSGGVGVVDQRADLISTTDALQRTSLDYYATLRSVSAQRRAALVAEGKAGGVDDSQSHTEASGTGGTD